ncbi:MAG: hypothetical protein FJX67_15585, partial [Alphaproteobacteria bacterium]|nr:hypothetical protein [Alphaproteobacteria bacterium]
MATRSWVDAGIGHAGDRLFDVVTRAPVASGASRRVGWLVRTGHWDYWWLNHDGRVWAGAFPVAALRLDGRATRGQAALAKRIAYHTLMLAWFVGSGGQVIRTIGRLLADVGALPQEGARGGHWAGRVRDRFDEALMTLCDIGVVGDARWIDGHGPGDPDRARGYVERWLAARVVIKLPPVFESERRASRPRARVRAVERRIAAES